MKNLFAFAIVACSLVLVSCGEKSATVTKDTVVVIAPVDSVVVVDTTPVVAPVDSVKKEEVKK